MEAEQQPSQKQPTHKYLAIPAYEFVWDTNPDTALVAKIFQKILEHRFVNDDIRAEIMTQQARAMGLLGQFDVALRILARAKEKSSAPISCIRYLLEYGRVLRLSGKPDESASYFRQAYDEAVNVEDYYAADAAHMLAILDPTAGPNDDTTWLEIVLAIARKSDYPPTKQWAAIALNDAAGSSFNQGDYQRAFETFTEESKLRKVDMETCNTAKTKDAFRNARWSIAHTLRHMNRDEEAYHLQRKLLSDVREELLILTQKRGYMEEAEEHKRAIEGRWKKNKA
ncbi:hypothetical protein Unana1_07696 [Umbelopsis nana]